MELTGWIADEITDIVQRLDGGVRNHVPPTRRADGAGGTSILWNTFHIARHSALALQVVTGEPLDEPEWLGTLATEIGSRGVGLSETAPDWAASLEIGQVDTYADVVLERVRRFLAAEEVAELDLDAVPDVDARLQEAGLARDDFGWLYGMWGGRPVGWLIRWPLLGHSGSHLGEMLATRTRLGLSPF